MDPSSIRIPIVPGLIHLSRVYVGVITPLLAISSVLVGVRLFTRFKSALGFCVEDWLMVLAAVGSLLANKA